MKLSLAQVTVVAALSATATADKWKVNTMCQGPNPCQSTEGVWITSNAAYSFDATEGCREPIYLPIVSWYCLDWANKRGHYYDDKGKNCMKIVKRETSNWDNDCDPKRPIMAINCDTSWWEKTRCTW